MEQASIPHAELQIMRQYREDAERQVHAMRPFIEQQLEIARTFAKAIEPMLRMAAEVHKAMAPIIEDFARVRITMEAFRESARMPSIGMPDQENAIVPFTRYARIHPDDADVLVERITFAVERRTTIPPRIAGATPAPVVDLPPGATWDDGKLGLKLRDDRTLSVYYASEHIGDYDHEQLGFARKNTNSQLPDRQWELLEKLSLAAMHGGAFKPTSEALAGQLGVSVNTLHQIKRSLAMKLRDAFGIAGRPFKRYDPVEGYRLKANLEPIALFRDGELYSSGGRLPEEM